MKILVPSKGRRPNPLLDVPGVTYVLQGENYDLKHADSVQIDVTGIVAVRQAMMEIADGEFYWEVDDDIMSFVMWGEESLENAPLVSSLVCVAEYYIDRLGDKLGHVGFYYRQFMRERPRRDFYLGRLTQNIRLVNPNAGFKYREMFQRRQDYDLQLQMMRSHAVIKDMLYGYGVAPRNIPGGNYREDHVTYDAKFKHLLREEHPAFYRDGEFDWRYAERIQRDIHSY